MNDKMMNPENNLTGSDDMQRQMELLALQQEKAVARIGAATGGFTRQLHHLSQPVHSQPLPETVERTGVYKDYVTCPTGIAEEIGFFARGIERSTGRSLYDERISVAEVDLFAGICVPNNGFSLDVARQTLQAVQDVESYRHLMPRLSSDLTFIEE